MKRMFGLLTATLLLCLAPTFAHAFCVYNHSDQTMFVQQVGPHAPVNGFAKSIAPGGQACCNWQDKSCNPAGGQDTMLEIDTETGNTGPVVGQQPGNWWCGHAPTSVLDSNQWNYDVPAAGWVDIVKTSSKPTQATTRQDLLNLKNSMMKDSSPSTTYIVNVYAPGGAQVAAWPCAPD